MSRLLWSALALNLLVACESPTRPGEPATPPVASPAGATALHFRTTNLGRLGGAYSIAAAINEQSEVVGFAPLASGRNRAFLWREGRGIRSLGTLGGTFSAANDINDLGDVVGVSNLPGDTTSHAFLWQPATGLQDLGILPRTGFLFFYSEARAINNRREIVGFAGNANLFDRAFLLQPGRRMRSLGTLGGRASIATDINDATEVVGTSLTASGDEHAFLWTAERGIEDLGTLGGSFSIATAISQNGAVTGQSAVRPGSDAAETFIWTRERGMRRLGTLGGPTSLGRELNTHYRVTGNSESRGSETTLPSLWTPEHGMVRLPTLIGFRGDGFGDAWSINEFGVIVGYSRDTPETASGTMWTPVAGPLAAPEPSASEAFRGAGDPTPSVSAAQIRAEICRVTAGRTPRWSRLRTMQEARCH